jgi:hypothetical protein
MKTISSGGYALSVCAAAAMLTGCGGGSISPASQLPGTNQSRAERVSSATAVHDASCQGQRSFKFTARAENFKVPACVTSVYVNALGAAGEGANASGGDGGEVSATIPVTPGETLVVMVGGAGAVAHGGFNGGAAGAGNRKGKELGGGGGGASDVREGGDALANRVVVAGGGGGTVIGRIHRSCKPCQANVKTSAGGGTGGGLPDGGGGGTPTCAIGTPVGGGGGTQSAGGAGGAGTNGGSLGNGGVGAGVCIWIIGSGDIAYFGSGGGGGYYGGGGGGVGGDGGGGSGYAEPTATNVSSQSGVNSGKGSVTICWGASNGECGTRQRIRR